MNTNTKTEILAFRVSPTIKKALEAATNASSRGLSSFIEKLVVRELFRTGYIEYVQENPWSKKIGLTERAAPGTKPRRRKSKKRDEEERIQKLSWKARQWDKLVETIRDSGSTLEEPADIASTSDT